MKLKLLDFLGQSVKGRQAPKQKNFVVLEEFFELLEGLFLYEFFFQGPPLPRFSSVLRGNFFKFGLPDIYHFFHFFHFSAIFSSEHFFQSLHSLSSSILGPCTAWEESFTEVPFHFSGG